MDLRLVVGMSDGSRKQIRGPADALHLRHDRLERARRSGRNEMIQAHLPTEGMMILSSCVSSVELQGSDR